MPPRIPFRLAIVAILLLALLVPALPAAAAPDYQGGIHVVQRGETLSQIARRYGVSTTALAQANGISNPKRLAIPGASGAANTGGAAASSGVHVVRPGENLSSIAARYGTSVAALARANGIANPNHIYVGQRLTIGSGGAVSSAPQAPSAARPSRRPANLPPAAVVGSTSTSVRRR